MLAFVFLTALVAAPAAASTAVIADRSALQTALFDCVGACGAALDGLGDETYCYTGNGPWGSGTGAECDAASTHGAIDAWDVSRVTSMYSIFDAASAFNQNLPSWNVGEVTDMQYSESSVRSLLLLVGCDILSLPAALLSLSLSCGVLPLLVSPPLSLPLLSHCWSPPPPPPPSVLGCLRLQPEPVLVERRQGHDHAKQ